MKQALANHWRPRQLQCPLGRALLVTEYKDVDLQHDSQLQLRLHLDSLSGTQTATASLLAAIPTADTRKTSWFTVTWLPMQRRPAGLQSPGCRFKEDQPACSHLAPDARKNSQPTANARKTNEPACCDWSFAGIRWACPALEFWGP